MYVNVSVYKEIRTEGVEKVEGKDEKQLQEGFKISVYKTCKRFWMLVWLEPILMRSQKMEISKLFSITYLAKQDM